MRPTGSAPPVHRFEVGVAGHYDVRDDSTLRGSYTVYHVHCRVCGDDGQAATTSFASHRRFSEWRDLHSELSGLMGSRFPAARRLITGSRKKKLPRYGNSRPAICLRKPNA